MELVVRKEFKKASESELKEFVEYIDKTYGDKMGDLFYSIIYRDQKSIDNILRYFFREFER